MPLAGLESSGADARMRSHRAPYASITRDRRWALDVLQDKGSRYDSSIFPTKNSLYGFCGAPRFPYRPITGTRFVEFPLSRVRIVGLKIPIAGGFYLRTLPYWFVRWASPASIRKDSRQSSTCTPGNWI